MKLIPAMAQWAKTETTGTDCGDARLNKRLGALLTALYLTVALYRISNLAFIAPDEPRYAERHHSTRAAKGSDGAPFLVRKQRDDPLQRR